MIDYKIIKNCRMCRKRFVVHKIESKRNFCNDCEPKSKGRGYYSWDKKGK